ncbi:MAG: hypothetical protein OEN02_05380 [Gammaproteobacteria bacterium]|nr:hypothetical protein [Gammaproteobacteria bacterium]MDH3534220.1 hypothetical protein [Gammaproteobacteria bacterium]
MKFAIFLPGLILFGLVAAQAQAQPRRSLVPGGIAIIALEPEDTANYRFRNKSVLIAKIDGAPSALVGLPLNLKPGEYFIEARDSSQVRKKFFSIEDKKIRRATYHHYRRA